MFKYIFAFVFMGATIGCGVKGEPQPPEAPPNLGRGRPTYDKASKELLEKEKTREEDEKKINKK